MSPEAGGARHDGRWKRLAAVTTVGVIVAAFPSLPSGIRNWDNVVKINVATNILHGQGPVVTGHTPDDAQYIQLGRNGERFTGYPPFAFVLQYPVVALGAVGAPVEGTSTIVLLGLVAWALVDWARKSEVSRAGAVVGAMLACFGTALWPVAAHGSDVLMEVLALALILRAGAGEERLSCWLLAGTVTGLAFASRVGAAGLGIPALVIVLARRPYDALAIVRRGLLFALGCAPGISMVLWFNELRFGSPFTVYTTSKAHGTLDQIVVPWFSLPHWEGMAGLTISPGKGIFWYGLPLIGTAMFVRHLARRYGSAFLAALAAYALASVVLLGRLVYWHSDWAWGPRYVTPLYLAVAPFGWWLWSNVEEGFLARKGAIAAILFCIFLQIVPVVGYPVETYFDSTLKPLVRQGRLVTTPLTRPPVPADNQLLYFRLDTSPMLSLARTFPATLLHPAGRPVRRCLLFAFLVPALALALLRATRNGELLH